MWEWLVSSFAKVNVSVDKDGFDSWSTQGVAKPPDCCAHEPPMPNWLEHDSLKSPWLYVEKSTPNAHVGFTDVGDLRFVHTNGSCPPPESHPGIVLNTPASKVHVQLEDITSEVKPTVLWDNWFSLKNSAPGGNGIKIIPTQRPVDAGSDSKDFMPFCFPSKDDVNVYENKYRMTVESVADDRDLSVRPFKDVFWLRPRPFCDTVVSPLTVGKAFLS
jgi:hypothetical protein